MPEESLVNSLNPGEVMVIFLLRRLFLEKNFICYEYLRKIYKGGYSFSSVTRYIRNLRSYGLLMPMGTRRGCFKPTAKFYIVYSELARNRERIVSIHETQ